REDHFLRLPGIEPAPEDRLGFAVLVTDRDGAAIHVTVATQKCHAADGRAEIMPIGVGVAEPRDRYQIVFGQGEGGNYRARAQQSGKKNEFSHGTSPLGMSPTFVKRIGTLPAPASSQRNKIVTAAPSPPSQHTKCGSAFSLRALSSFAQSKKMSLPSSGAGHASKNFA